MAGGDDDWRELPAFDQVEQQRGPVLAAAVRRVLDRQSSAAANSTGRGGGGQSRRE